jgi:hypothetical protein
MKLKDEGGGGGGTGSLPSFFLHEKIRTQFNNTKNGKFFMKYILWLGEKKGYHHEWQPFKN